MKEAASRKNDSYPCTICTLASRSQLNWTSTRGRSPTCHHHDLVDLYSITFVSLHEVRDGLPLSLPLLSLRVAMLVLTWPMQLVTLSFTSMTGVWTWLPGVPTSTSTLARGPLLASLCMRNMLTIHNYQGTYRLIREALDYTYMYLRIRQ